MDVQPWLGYWPSGIRNGWPACSCVGASSTLAVKLGLNADYYGTHSMRRTKATLIDAKTKNIRAVQILLGHSKLDNTIRYLGVELEDALRLSEQTDC